MRILAALLFAVSSVSAYQVTYPTAAGGWTTHGPNWLLWNRVSTDPPTFAVVLKNLNLGSEDILEYEVDGTNGSIICNPPSGGWRTGPAFQVDISQDYEHPDSLLAQSPQFAITS